MEGHCDGQEHKDLVGGHKEDRDSSWRCTTTVGQEVQNWKSGNSFFTFFLKNQIGQILGQSHRGFMVPPSLKVFKMEKIF